MRIVKPLHLLVLVVLFISLLPDISFAEPRGVVVDIMDKFSTQASIYGTTLEGYAERLFYWCLILDVVLLGIRVSLNRDDIASMIKQFVFILLFAGFIFAVIKNYDVWSMNLIKGLNSVAVTLGGPNLDLSPFDTGMNLVKGIIDETSGWTPMSSLGFLIVGAMIMVCFALITAQIVLVKCEAYIAMNAAVLLLGFGGSSLLKEYAINTMRYALSVAFKLFVMQLVVGIGMSFLNDFQDTNMQLEDLLILVGAAVVLLALVKTIPDVCAGIINGSHTNTGGSLMSTAAAVGAVGVGVAAGGASMARGVGSVKAAAQMAGHQGKTGWAKVGGTAKNIMDANSSSRQDRNAWGGIGQRMNSHLKQGREAAKVSKNLNNDQT
ncbi:P-type conjugative transfer protein TrbL [Desulfopila sp. IMCC35006]|uniref:P-type conjugative transfer protein TrbL n=1 Tax=Desulfopila sp. IMCC35006 TaxID=2569542 RepID=UPI00142EF959|nr:P-type conjugative transfer protein TrbL [Desulfopila sp. IMCC35006]